ncbi:SRPBCC domain-containing protein [Nocardia coubleae]|uniref:SRPBCC domain-containing protein n=2 Tax=Nocardia coubleae TaxID=356147 RepID=A0A846W8T6_9NOCA|nr:SRPBCC domain-containing protein [Nocardia coubleae]
MKAQPSLLYAAWTQGLDLWLAVPGSVLMRPAVNEPLYFDTGSDEKRNPHYGRILTLEANRRIEFTWVTAATEGVETVVAAEFLKQPRGIRLRLRHSGFPTAAIRDLHQQVWPEKLERLDEVTSIPV